MAVQGSSFLSLAATVFSEDARFDSSATLVEFYSVTVTLSVTISVTYDVGLSCNVTGWDVSQSALPLGTSSEFDFLDDGPALLSDLPFLLNNVVISWELVGFVFNDLA